MSRPWRGRSQMRKKIKLGFLYVAWSALVFGTHVDSQAQSFLDLKIDKFVIQQASVEEALAKLHLYGVLVCLEKVPRSRGSEEKLISLDLREVSIGNILDEIVKADPRYEWEYVELSTGCSLINVLPKGAKENPKNLLNTKVAIFEINNLNAEEAVSNIYDLSPELQQRIKYAGRAGSTLTGVPAASDHKRRKISLLLENMTVRQILNELICMSSNNRTGWLFEFIIDQSYPSGGYHISRIF
jgi:hypothetical protein